MTFQAVALTKSGDQLQKLSSIKLPDTAIAPIL